MIPLFYVNVYECGRAYGGQEEGGWWYDQHEFIEEDSFYASEKDALARADAIKPQWSFTTHHTGYHSLDGCDPDGNGDDNYLTRGGMWGEGKIEIKVETHFGMNYPQRRPHYE
tara:strand:- start:62 stop:400 length:339 start_codon:yes stop_codon:yes gene_type:complete